MPDVSEILETYRYNYVSTILTFIVMQLKITTRPQEPVNHIPIVK